MKNLTKKQRVDMIGKKCRVSAIYTGKPEWVKIKIKERHGWITGFGVIRRGEKVWLGYDEGMAFAHKETIRVVKIRFWVTEKEHNVPLDAFVLDDLTNPCPSMAKYSSEYKKAYQDQKECYPRDKNGRFVSPYKVDEKKTNFGF